MALLFLANIAPLLSWGIIISLRYLKPAMQGIASVAYGPAIIVIAPICR
ncbi:hypothetical protein yrohd0001_4590 [Yersinia rohdei ATCC 43380]|nr:hypothetical protein [Yersinia rohdei]EEQ03493.1 hypothetical protein yrohd0001_4590 [Yersinia rohdei ATCC 43380]